VLGAWLLAGATLGASSPAAAEPAKPVSSCVACHTDAEKLKVEAAKVPPAPASALQAGKG
jgi:cytochrome c553